MIEGRNVLGVAALVGLCLWLVPRPLTARRDRQGRRRRGRTRVAGRPFTSPGGNASPVTVALVSRPAAGLPAPLVFRLSPLAFRRRRRGRPTRVQARRSGVADSRR